MNKMLSREARAKKIQDEIWTLKVERAKIDDQSYVESGKFYRDNDKYWELDAKIAAAEIVLENLTSICQFCDKDGAEMNFSDGSKICRECLKWYFYECFNEIY